MINYNLKGWYRTFKGGPAKIYLPKRWQKALSTMLMSQVLITKLVLFDEDAKIDPITAMNTSAKPSNAKRGKPPRKTIDCLVPS